MKTRKLSFLSLGLALPMLALTGPAFVGAGCGGGGGGNGGTGGGGGPNLNPDDKISDFEDPVAATVLNAGTPVRNGYWYSYNEKTTVPTSGCTQIPASGEAYVPTPHPSGTPGPDNGLGSTMALHAQFSGCGTDPGMELWGAGVGADFNQPMVPDGGMYEGPKQKYDVSAYKGITFWGRAEGGASSMLRLKVNLFKITAEGDGGGCVPQGTLKCSDDWGQVFTLPATGAWTQVTVMFPPAGTVSSATAMFKQEGWGIPAAWDPADVTSMQIQSTGPRDYNFWIDDVYFIK